MNRHVHPGQLVRELIMWSALWCGIILAVTAPTDAATVTPTYQGGHVLAHMPSVPGRPHHHGRHAEMVRAARRRAMSRLRASHRRRAWLALFAKWQRVAICEEGGNWHAQPWGGLGDKEWAAFGGLRFAPTAGDATIAQQIIVARRIEGPYYVPDQYGCAAW